MLFHSYAIGDLAILVWDTRGTCALPKMSIEVVRGQRIISKIRARINVSGTEENMPKMGTCAMCSKPIQRSKALTSTILAASKVLRPPTGNPWGRCLRFVRSTTPVTESSPRMTAGTNTIPVDLAASNGQISETGFGIARVSTTLRALRRRTQLRRQMHRTPLMEVVVVNLLGALSSKSCPS